MSFFSNSFLLVFLIVSGALMSISLMMSSNVGDSTPQAELAAAMRRKPGWVPLPGNLGLKTAAASKVYYDPTIRDIILADCSSCHGGAVRNLMDYDNLNAYAQSGMLEAMIQGPMAQFAGADASTILDWVAAGAPEHPAGAAGTAPAAWRSQTSHPGAVPHQAGRTPAGGQSAATPGASTGWRALP
ncbi:hypothetical protein NNJEOMEG_00152 [Fundidesulfovibrio magnetotacticus]|uniref:Cytochrome c domain-containing protein n=2 Tax=Fundidesulfovibrio magnetotacticus TaxID=2730080 RepID=A0A6V8LPR6_9BACT|nr:hypothetical protein NNJEOMEG_00152 [Fundidesulfovibrio magnetotacticus]